MSPLIYIEKTLFNLLGKKKTPRLANSQLWPYSYSVWFWDGYRQLCLLLGLATLEAPWHMVNMPAGQGATFISPKDQMRFQNRFSAKSLYHVPYSDPSIQTAYSEEFWKSGSSMCLCQKVRLNVVNVISDSVPYLFSQWFPTWFWQLADRQNGLCLSFGFYSQTQFPQSFWTPLCSDLFIRDENQPLISHLPLKHNFSKLLSWCIIQNSEVRWHFASWDF